MRGIWRVNLYQTHRGGLIMHTKGPNDVNDVVQPETIEEANEYIYSLMAQYPSQVKVTRWGDLAGAISNDQLQKETLSCLQGKS
jgi:hypothetical protein